MTWNDQQYLRFGDERTRAARELLSRVPVSEARHVVDLGCGPGNSTVLLAERYPHATLTGVDDSPEMLKRARSDYPNIAWLERDLREFEPSEPLDVLFANAVLQWLPAHDELFPRLFSQLRPGGALAVQMPRNFEEPSHRAMRETQAAPGHGDWGARLASVRASTPVASPEFYYDLLAPHARSVDIWQTTYQHVMTDAAAIVEWVKGTGLRPYLDALSDSERPHFLERYTAAIDQAYPARADGKRLFAFPRLFIVAVR